jgi:hypothetical protein
MIPPWDKCFIVNGECVEDWFVQSAINVLCTRRGKENVLAPAYFLKYFVCCQLYLRLVNSLLHLFLPLYHCFRDSHGCLRYWTRFTVVTIQFEKNYVLFEDPLRLKKEVSIEHICNTAQSHGALHCIYWVLACSMHKVTIHRMPWSSAWVLRPLVLCRARG